MNKQFSLQCKYKGGDGNQHFLNLSDYGTTLPIMIFIKAPHKQCSMEHTLGMLENWVLVKASLGLFPLDPVYNLVSKYFVLLNCFVLNRS